MNSMIKIKFRFSILLLAAVFILSVPACKDELLDVETVSLFSNENIFSNVDYTRQAVLGIYQLMTRDEGYSKRLSMYYGVDTDVAMCSGSLDNGRRGIARYAATSGNTELEKPWRNLYNGIERANICIKNIPESSLYTEGTEEQITAMKRMHGEALTLRALHYFELIRNWGDVPFKTSPSQAGDNFELPKTNRNEIYAQIIDDLKLAEQLVPWRSEVVADERITKGAVKGLLARIALARGGYSLRRESRTMERDADYLEYYELARDQCKEIMESNEHSMNPDFEDIFKTQCERQLDTDYGESMWEVALGQYESGEVAYYIAAQQASGSRYGRADGGVLALPTFYLSYDSLDTRRDHTIAIYEIDDDNLRLVHSFSDIRIGKWRREWMSPLMPGTDKFTGINWMLLRYTDVLMMYAEAVNEINQEPTDEAINILRIVRERAFKGNEDKIGEIPTDYSGFFNAIVNERAWEFAGEALRKYDLIRWNLIDEKLSETKENMQKLYDGEDPYDEIPRQLVWRNNGEDYEILNLNLNMDSVEIANRDSVMWPNITDWAENVTSDYIEEYAGFFEPNRKELLPIHQSIVDANSNLTNDYGY